MAIPPSRKTVTLNVTISKTTTLTVFGLSIFATKKETMINLIVNNKIELQNYRSIDFSLCKELMKRFEMPNPVFEDAEKHGRYTGEIEHTLKFWSASEDSLFFPRGAGRRIADFLRYKGIDFKTIDNKREIEPVDFSFLQGLRPYQDTAVQTVLPRPFGTLVSPTGSGKTTMALAVIAERKQPTIVITHTKELLNQWVERIEQFLGIPASEVGIIGNGKFLIGEKITVALVQSLLKRLDEVVHHVGHVVVDECHRVASRTFTEAVTSFDSKYMLGLSATPYRRDRLGKLIWFFIGDKVHEVDAAELKDAGHVLRPELIEKDIALPDFYSNHDPVAEYSSFVTDLVESIKRNRIIADSIESAVSEDRYPIVLSDRINQLDILEGMLTESGVSAAMLTGELPKKERIAVMEAVRNKQIRVLLASTGIASEGLDIAHLDSVFFASPMKFDGKVVQCVGRVLRPLKGKQKPRIYDFVDSFGVMQAQARSRRRAYEKIMA